jgi:FAD/FMN-containing dehydrogenase
MSEQLISANGKSITESAIGKLESHFRGLLVRPSDDVYDDSRRLWSGSFDKRPALIARCSCAADVAKAVEFARENDLIPAIRAGGHSLAGKSVSEGGLTIDLSPMKRIRVDAEQRVADAEAGLMLGEFDQATVLRGLATTMGTAPDTGMAGLVLGGGLGWLMARNGLACDNVLEIEAITADGHIIRASEEENPDLFWGVRGAGANFGIVTSFKFRLHPISTVLGGTISYPIAHAGRVLRRVHELLESMPDELVMLASGGLLAGQPALSVTLCWSGDLETGEKALAPLRSLGPILRDSVAPIPYQAMQAMLTMPAGLKGYWKSGFVHELNSQSVEPIIAHMETAPSPTSGWFVFSLHGAVCRVKPTDTAFAHRAQGWDFSCTSLWEDTAMAEPSTSWVRSFWDRMEPYCAGVYVNTMGEEGEARVRAAYGPNYERLVALKNKYDPTNFFRMNQNIKPTASQSDGSSRGDLVMDGIMRRPQ